MTLDDAPEAPAPLTRRARRAAAAEAPPQDAFEASAPPPTEEPVIDAAAPEPAVEVPSPTPREPRRALAWVIPEAVLAETHSDLGIDLDAPRPDAPDLLAETDRRARTRSARAAVMPLAVVALVAAAYAAATLLWPLGAIAPTITAVEIAPVSAPAATMTWPTQGSAAVGVKGLGTPVASSDEEAPIGSIAKVVTALLVLDDMPLSTGEGGPEFRFGASDVATYYRYLSRGESALPVPSGGTLSQRQLLEGVLVGSAGNYTERLVGNSWPNDAVYLAAARTWLDAHGLHGVTVDDTTGFDVGSRARPAALIALAETALANPVIAEIVAEKDVTLPAAGKVENTNRLLADDGVVGIKTGTLDTYSLLSAKDITIGATTVRLYAAVLGQKNDAARLAASRDLYAQLEAQLRPTTAVAAGTTVANVDTVWGERVAAVAANDAEVVLWNSSPSTAALALSVGDATAQGDAVGSLTVSGGVDSATIDVTLAGDIDGPSPWWRLTHPLHLLGILR